MKKTILILFAFYLICSCNTTKSFKYDNNVLNQQNNILSQQKDALSSFKDFEKTEKERDLFIQEVIELDSLLNSENYIEKVRLLESQKLSITIDNEVIKLDFSQMFCDDLSSLSENKKTENINKLRNEKKLSLTCRGIASDIDIFPTRTGNLSKDSKTYLETIKKLINENQHIIIGMTYKDYLKLEQNKNITTDSKRFIFRKKFLKFLNSEYNVSSN
ncbi:hypothetical protein [uncultured Psychroserpens sp.]|uniref:hypothetical protein n=1 Tax=uncultured Psychroserpens sp. TaxID=255436 RepID=UPI0026037D76|nr:hypothetical protein [uncultured Psychroserpens sp.]